MFSADDVSHIPECVEGLLAMRGSETGGELIQFLQTSNCMYTSLPKMADVVAPLRDLLEEAIGGGKRTKREANNKPNMEEHWAFDWQESRDAALGELSDAVKLAYPK